jgi:hypothetical protein
MTGFYKDYADSSDTHQNSAEASADAAEQSATEAAASAAAALNSKNNASTSESNASNSAAAALASQSLASASATSALALSYDAEDSATQAAASALAASGYKDDAEGSANQAAASALAASGHADDAEDLEITSASFDTTDGTLTLTKANSGTITTDLDGRYADLSGATFTGDVTAKSKLTVIKQPVASDLLTTSRSIQDLAAWYKYVADSANYDLTPEKYRDAFDTNEDNRFSSGDFLVILTFVTENYTSNELSTFNSLISNPSNITSTFVQDVIDGDYDSLSTSAGVTIDKDASSFVTVNGNTTFNNDVLFNDGVKAKFGTDNDLLIYHNDGEPSVIEDAGELGLLLKTNGNVFAVTSDTNESMITATPDGGVFLYHDNQLRFSIGESLVSVSSGADFSVNDDTLFVDSGEDRVGIGTTSPDKDLHIAATNGPTIRLERNQSEIPAGGVIGAIEFESQDASTGSSGVVGKIEVRAKDTSPDTRMAFYTHENNSGTGSLEERMRIDESGRVGIGTTSPAQKLDVAGQIKADDAVLIQGTGYGRLEVGGGTGAYIDLKTPDSDDYDFRVIHDSAGSKFISPNADVKFDVGGQTRAIIEAGGDINLNGNVTVDGTLNGGTYERTVRTRFQRRGYTSVYPLHTLSTSYTQVGDSLRIDSGATTAVENVLDLNITIQFSDVNSTNDGMFVVTVDAPNPSNETTVNLGTVTSTSQGIFKVAGDFTKHFSPYCGMSTNSDGSNSFAFVNYEGWSYDPVNDETMVRYNPFQSNTPSTGDTVYLHPFDWETQGTEINGEEYPIDAYNQLGTVHQNQFHQIYLGYYKPERTFKIKAKELSTGENIFITKVAGSYSQIIGS